MILSTNIAITPGAEQAFTPEQIASCLARHISGDWGDMPEDDQVRNNRAIADRDGLMSSYAVDGQTLWVITDAGWAVTTALLPDEY